MSNDIKIIVSGQNKFAATHNALVKQLGGVKDATAAAGKEADRLEAAFDRVSKRAKVNAVAVSGAAREQRAYAAAVSATGRAFDKMGDDAEKGSKKARDGLGDGVADAATAAAEKAASGFMSAGLSAAKSLVGGITDGVSKAGPYVQGSLVAVGATAAVGAGPLIGGALAGGVVTAFGAGIAGIGIAAAAQSDRVKNAFENMWQRATDRAKEAAQPLEQVLVNFAGRAEKILGGDGLSASFGRSIATMAPGLDRFGDSLLRAFSKFEPAVEPMTRAFGRVLDDLGPTLERTMAGISDAFKDVAESVAENPEALGDFVEMMGDVVETGLDAVGMLNTWWEANKRLVDIATTPFEWAGLKDGGEDAAAFVKALDSVAESTWSAKSPADMLGESWESTAEAGKKLAEAGTNLWETFDILSGRSPAFEESAQKINDTIRGLVERFSDVKNHVDGYSQALINADGTVNTTTENGSALRDSLTSLQQAYSDQTAAVRQLEAAGMSHDEAVRTVSASLAEQSNRLLDQHGKLGLTREQMQRLLDAYSLAPKTIHTFVDLDDSSARQKLAWLKSMASQVAGAMGDLSILPSGRSPDARATGGVSSGNWTTVGELGPERVKLPPGAQVMPHTQSTDLMGAQGGGMPLGGGPLVLEIRSGGSRMDDLLVQIIRDSVVRQGGSVQQVLGKRS